MLHADNLQKLEHLRQKYPAHAKRSLIIPCLYMIQEQYGFIPPEAPAYLAQTLAVPLIWIREAVSWYSMIQSKKLGKYHIQVCHNLSCSLRGAETLLPHIQKKLGISVGETTADEKFTLSTVECLAACGSAPVMQINEKFYENLTPEKVDQILAELH